MKNRTLVRLTISFTALAWMLSALHGFAQTGLTGPRGMGARGPAPGPLSQAEGAPAASPKYAFTIFDFPNTFYTDGFGINSGAASANMEIVGGLGNIAGPAGFTGGFLMLYAKTTGVATETFEGVDFPGATQQLAIGVNDSGEIVGQYADSSGVSHGYLQKGDNFTTIDVPFSGAVSTDAEGITNSGEIVGYWDDASTSHGFLISGGTYTSFDYPGAVFTIADAINNHGEITGFYADTSGVYHGFMLSGGTYTSIDAPGATATEAYGVNDNGDIVGIYCLNAKCADNFETFEGYILSGGSFTTITIPGAAASGPSGINNEGVVAGVYYDAGGHHGFLATPK
jgi:hypothetical protein